MDGILKCATKNTNLFGTHKYFIFLNRFGGMMSFQVRGSKNDEDGLEAALTVLLNS